MAMMANLEHKQRINEYNSIEPFRLANFTDAIKRRFRFNMNLNYDYQCGLHTRQSNRKPIANKKRNEASPQRILLASEQCS